MADRVVVIDVFEYPGHMRVGSRVSTTFEYTPDTQESNVFKVYAAFVADADIGALTTGLADNALGGTVFP